MIPLLLAARGLARALAAVWRDPETKALPPIVTALPLTLHFPEASLSRTGTVPIVARAPLKFPPVVVPARLPVSRAATSIELGCANPDEPCKLPNAMAGDPPLSQVGTRSIEGGVRGTQGPTTWHAGIFRAENQDDILFAQPVTVADALARELARAPHLALVCGRYEGIDERVRSLVDREVSIGDYVVTGGELPALVLIDAVVRLLPGAILEASHEGDSFATGLLEYPQYTRPESFRSMDVPPVLLSGNHGEVDRWRRREALQRTVERRPDLLESAPLTDADRSPRAA